MARQKHANPTIRWDDGTWFVTLPVDNGKTIEASWKPAFTYVVRIRQAGHEEWSFGFETPVDSFTFTDLKPDTKYQLQVRTKNAAGEGTPEFFTIHTGPAGHRGNVVPFPRQ